VLPTTTGHGNGLDKYLSQTHMPVARVADSHLSRKAFPMV
jgi:hypothetical protein